jgi:hypothetical protein
MQYYSLISALIIGVLRRKAVKAFLHETSMTADHWNF